MTHSMCICEYATLRAQWASGQQLQLHRTHELLDARYSRLRRNVDECRRELLERNANEEEPCLLGGSRAPITVLLLLLLLLLQIPQVHRLRFFQPLVERAPFGQVFEPGGR